MESKIKWKDDILTAFSNIGSASHIENICKEIFSIRKAAGRSTPNKFRQTVQRTLQNFSSDASDFKKSKDEDLFRMVEGKGKGVWGLRC